MSARGQRFMSTHPSLVLPGFRCARLGNTLYSVRALTVCPLGGKARLTFGHDGVKRKLPGPDKARPGSEGEHRTREVPNDDARSVQDNTTVAALGGARVDGQRSGRRAVRQHVGRLRGVGRASSPMKRGQRASAPPPSRPCMATSYSTATISADRGQRSFKLSLDQFLAKRGGPAIVARGRTLKQTLCGNVRVHRATLRRAARTAPGDPGNGDGLRGPTAGNIYVLSATATLAYDCRRSSSSTEHLYAALTLIDRKYPFGRTRAALRMVRSAIRNSCPRAS